MSCDMRIPSVSTVKVFSFWAKCFEFLHCCWVSPYSGLMIFTSALETLYVTDLMLLTVGHSGEPGLCVFSVP